MNILVTGASGRLGKELKKLLPFAFSPSHTSLDIGNRLNVFKYVINHKIDRIIHCAALTSIRYCEEHREEAYNVNVKGTINLSDALSSFNPHGYFIYVSTACVFDGYTDFGYAETDVPCPKNFYALTKLLGEFTVLHKSNVLIVRTNFIERGTWPYPKAFVDRYANYLYSDQVAKEIIKLMKKKMNGIVHICGDKQASIYDFACLTDPNVKPMTLKEYQGPPLTVNMTLKSIHISHIRFKG